MDRAVVMGRNGMVASAHMLASLAGVDVLKRGGTAVDAAVATNVVLNVTQPHMCSIGGDLFLLIYTAETGQIHFLNASGRAPAAATREWFAAHGHSRMPMRGPLAITVPGCVDGWATAWQRYGRYPWDRLFDAAIEYAEVGFPISHTLCEYIEVNQELLEQHPATSAILLPNGAVPRPGDVFVQTDLAGTLRTIAEQGRDGFYRGRVAEQIAAAIGRAGGLIAVPDLANHRSDWREPRQTTYRDYTVTVTGDNTQGITALLALNILEASDLARHSAGSPEATRLTIDAIMRAFEDRHRYISDPEFVAIPYDRVLSKVYAAECRTEIAHRAATTPGHPDADTTAYSVVDGEGNIVTAIQSVYLSFGSGVIADGTGVVFQNRGFSFSLDPDHPNTLEPGKRPFHTLMATMVQRPDGKPIISFSTMGGDGQPQTTVQVLTNLLDFGMNIQEAIEAPRWLYGLLQESDREIRIHLESRFPAETVAALQRAGYPVNVAGSRMHKMGHAQSIVLSPETGVLMGGADPRGDGFALGW